MNGLSFLIIQAELMKDLFGQALLDFQQKTMGSPLLLHTEYGPPETLPLERFFVGEDEFPDLDIFTLEQVYGKILDIGAATGRHALYLQNQGHDVTAMDISESCGIVIKEMGVEKIIIKDIFNFEGQIFDTIFMLMNGIGIAGTIEGLKKLLRHLKPMLKPTSQLLLILPISHTCTKTGHCQKIPILVSSPIGISIKIRWAIRSIGYLLTGKSWLK